MKIKIKASKDAIEEAETGGGDFVDAPDGYYVCELVRLEQKEGKQSKTPYLNCSWKPVGKGRDNDQLPEAYSWLWDTVTLEGDSTEWKRAEFLVAVGKKPGPRAAGMDIEIEPDKPGTVIGTLALVRVGSEIYKPEGGEAVRKAIVKKVFPFDPDAVGDDDEGAADEGDDDGAPTEALDEGGFDDDGDGSAEDTDAVVDSGDDDYVPWTEETLKEGDADEVKARLKELAGDFSVEIKKGMKVNDVVAAILEAQEAYMATLGDGDDTFGGDEGDLGDEPF